MPHLEHISDEDSLQRVIKYHQLLSNLPTGYKIEDMLLLPDADLRTLSISANLKTAIAQNKNLQHILKNTIRLEAIIDPDYKPTEKNLEPFRKANNGVIHKKFIPQADIPANNDRIEVWLDGLPQFVEKSTEDLEADDAQNSAASLAPSFNDDVVPNSGNFDFTNSDISLPGTSL